jgi:hypothetical protein
MSYRILSLDGGGTWALIQVKALIGLYGPNATGHGVLKDFDLVAANSGGSIVLGGLVENMPLGTLLAFFQDQSRRQSVFSPTHSFGDKVLHDLTGMGPKYSAENKLPALETVFPKTGTQKLSDAVSGIQRANTGRDIHLLITAFDYDRNRATFFRSSPASGPAWGTGEPSDTTLAEAIHSSTNAPVNYFDAPATFPDRPDRYWDGAIAGCNNPVLAAVTEAIVLKQSPLDLAVLSIGTASVALPWPQTGDDPSPYVQQIANASFATDLRKLATSILDDPPDIATFLAHVLTGSGLNLEKPPAVSRVVRMNPLICPVRNAGAWSAPGAMSAAQFTYLAKLDMDAVEQAQVDAISSYADLWVVGVALNQPIRMDGDTLAPELGPTTYQGAAAAWSAIK